VRWLAGHGADTVLDGLRTVEAKTVCAFTPHPPHSKTLARGLRPTRLIARRNRHGQIAADGARQEFLDFIVPGNGLLAPGLRVAPDGMAAAFANGHAPMFLKMAEQCPAFHASTSSVVSAWGSSRKTSSRSVSSSS